MTTSVVADKIVELVQNKTWKLRHPTGPDAEGFLQYQASISDEELYADRLMNIDEAAEKLGEKVRFGCTGATVSCRSRFRTAGCSDFRNTEIQEYIRTRASAELRAP